MKLAKTSEKEIYSLLKLCQDLEAYSKNKKSLWEEVKFNQKNYPKLAKLANPEKDPEQFILDLAYQFERIHYQRILWNLLTLLSNCADKKLDHLDFNPKIKAGFEALELLKEVDDYLKPNPKNYVGNGSILHNKAKEILASVKPKRKKASSKSDQVNG